MPDVNWGEVVVAYVQPRPGLTVHPTALEAQTAQHLSGYKRPTAYIVVNALPRNAVGKIDKPTLRNTHTEVSTAHSGS